MRNIPQSIKNLLVLVILAACSFHAEDPPSVNQESHPNILFILVDDMDVASLAYMPIVNEILVNQGMSFSNYFINVSLCCPSRATTLLGQYAHNTKIFTNGGPNGGYKTFFESGLEEKTIAVELQAAGYRTVLLGKYLNGYPLNYAKKTYVPPGWNRWYSPVGGDPYFNLNYKLNEQGEVVHYKDRPEDYLTDVLSNKAKLFIQENSKREQPFFMYLAPYAPHGPVTPALRHAAMFTGVKAPRTEAFNEQDVSDKPEYIRNLPQLTAKDKASIDRLFAGRLRMLQAVDEMVANLVQTLEENGQLDNTYIIFTSDNGFHLGEHRLAPGKATPYEADIRVPFIVRGPGVQAGYVQSAISGNVDLAPTFAAIAGLSRSNSYDGRSLLTLIHQSEDPQDWRTATLIEHWYSKSETEDTPKGVLEPQDPYDKQIVENNADIRPGFKGLRTAGYLYVEYFTGEMEFYDLRLDPNELNNLASEINPQLLAQLSDWLQDFSACKGANCVRIDRKFIELEELSVN